MRQEHPGRDPRHRARCRARPARPAARRSASACGRSSTTPRSPTSPIAPRPSSRPPTGRSTSPTSCDPALAAGRTVVSDRSVWSTLGYQGYGRGLDLEVLRAHQRLGDRRAVARPGDPVGRPVRRARPPHQRARPRPLRAGRRRLPRPRRGRLPGDGGRRPDALDGRRRRRGPGHRRRRGCAPPSGSSVGVTSVGLGRRRRPAGRGRRAAGRGHRTGPRLPVRRAAAAPRSTTRRGRSRRCCSPSGDAPDERDARLALPRRAPRRPRGRARRPGDLRRAGPRDHPRHVAGPGRGRPQGRRAPRLPPADRRRPRRGCSSRSRSRRRRRRSSCSPTSCRRS